MKSVWTKGLDKDGKAKREKEMRAGKPILAALESILDHKERNAQAAKKPDFVDNAWPYKAADTNGYLRAVQEIKAIISQE